MSRDPGDLPGPAPTLLSRERLPVEEAITRFMRNRLDRLDRRTAAPIRYALDSGGKRLRPILCVGTCKALQGAKLPPAGYDAACAIEVIHTYSLLHDDLPCMDDDALRRGRPTAHRVYGTAQATIAGAAMIPLAFAQLAGAAEAMGLDGTAIKAAVHELAEAAGAAGMVGGQMMDLEAEGRTVDVAELQRIHARKTGALFVASMRIGGFLAGAGDAILDALAASGRALGLAFQVMDDILDVTGVDAVLGKTAGRDREQGKATYPGLIGLDAARERARAAAGRAVAALHDVAVHDDGLEGLIDFAVNRDR
jgi:geranylgeranyl diphosphate synthase, type II